MEGFQDSVFFSELGVTCRTGFCLKYSEKSVTEVLSDEVKRTMYWKQGRRWLDAQRPEARRQDQRENVGSLIPEDWQ